MKLKAGDLVQVRSKEDILRTLDHKGRLDELPFMPSMFKYCGNVFRVYKRAHKTCDTVNRTGGRRLTECVHLEVRCDGEAYGGCQAGCLIFWKEAWLKPLGLREKGGGPDAVQTAVPADQSVCTEQEVRNGCRVSEAIEGSAARYSCQATQLPFYTTPLRWWDVRQYVEDLTSGNVTPRRAFRGFAYLAVYHFTQAWRNKVGRPTRWLYDRIQVRRGGVPFPRKRGRVPDSERTPTSDLNLRPGEYVRVKSHDEILATVQVGGLNRGLLFDAEMVPYCGQVFRVKTRVEKFINESDGTLVSLKTPAVILEKVWCQARYSNCKMFCPRSIYSWWREVWLERVD